MKLLISGATGFIGTHLVRRRSLLDDELAVIVRPDSNISRIPEKCTIFTFDGDQERLNNYVSRERFDGLVHLATHFSASHLAADIPKLINSNILFGTQLLEAVTHSNVPWVINTSTFTQHFEDKSYAPVNLYSATKQAFEDIAKYYNDTSNTAFTSIALFDTFGPGDNRRKIMNILMDAARNHTQLDMSPGQQIMDISPIENVIDGFDQMISLMSGYERELLRGMTFALPSRERLSLRELVRTFEEVLGERVKVNFGAREYRQREVMIPWSSCHQVPGWIPRISLRDAIRSFIDAQCSK